MAEGSVEAPMDREDGSPSMDAPTASLDTPSANGHDAYVYPFHTHGGTLEGNAAPPPSDAEALRQAERARPLEAEYEGQVTPWYDGRWELRDNAG